MICDQPNVAGSSPVPRTVSNSLPPGFVVPMAPTLVETAPDGGQWQHEIKYDGYRTQVVIRDGKAVAYTRNGHDWSDKYAPVVSAASRLRCRSARLDGEMIVQDAHGRSDYHALRRAIGSEPHRLVFYAFDLLAIDGTDMRPQPLRERRERLTGLVPFDDRSPVHVTTHFVGNGPTVFAHADQHGLEGIVSKLADSRYTSGPTSAWLKTKAFTVETFEIIGVKIADNGMPYAIMANAAGEDAGEAFVTLPKPEREAFWQCVEMLATPRARLAPFLKRRHKATWLKAGLSARVKHLRGEEKLRHATIVSVEASRAKPWRQSP